MGTLKIKGELWGNAARDWAEIQEPLHRPLWEAMLNAAEVGTGTRILDAGCGGGGASVLAAERGAQVSGLDAAEELITIACERVPNGDFRVGDIESLPFDDDAFEAVFAANSLQYAEDRVAALCEFGRVCTPKGRIIVGLFGQPDKVQARKIFMAMRDAMPEPPPGGGPFELSMPGMLEGLFEAAGLKVVEYGEIDCPFNYPDFETFWRASISIGPAQGMLRVVSEEKLMLATRDAVKAFRLDDGSILIQPNVYKYVVATL